MKSPLHSSGSDRMQEAISLEYRIETPENVHLEYTLAGPVQRGIAWLIDGVVRIVLIFIVFIVLALFGTIGNDGSVANGWMLVFLFFMEWGYFVICELLSNGRSPGKSAVGLRVVQEQGYTITPSASLLRNLMRVIDALPLFYGLGLIGMCVSPRFQRWGDAVARTIVVREQASTLSGQPAIFRKRQPLKHRHIIGMRPPATSLALIEQLHVRRQELSTTPEGYARGHAIARPLASALSAQTGLDEPIARTHPMAYLADVHVTWTAAEADQSGIAKKT